MEHPVGLRAQFHFVVLWAQPSTPAKMTNGITIANSMTAVCIDMASAPFPAPIIENSPGA